MPLPVKQERHFLGFHFQTESVESSRHTIAVLLNKLARQVRELLLSFVTTDLACKAGQLITSFYCSQTLGALRCNITRTLWLCRGGGCRRTRRLCKRGWRGITT